MNKENKPPMDIQEFSEELFDKYGYYIDDNLSDMEMVTGRSIILENDFMLACADVANWRSYQHSYTEQKLRQALTELLSHAPASDDLGGYHSNLKQAIVNANDVLKDTPNQGTPPTYTQEQMIAFGEAVKQEALRKADYECLDYGRKIYRVNPQSILSIDISKLLKK